MTFLLTEFDQDELIVCDRALEIVLVQDENTVFFFDFFRVRDGDQGADYWDYFAHFVVARRDRAATRMTLT